MSLPHDYAERVYAGVLGKIIGVYLGRPFEGWTHDRIRAELGDVNYYVHEKRGVPLVVTDDDISGTFTFLRALEDYGPSTDVTPAQIGQTWLNYIIENRTILWWGGMGNSTEHTAYLRLKSGVPAPESGSIALNGKVVAEQIGAQIFIDGWGMVAPGDPQRAADFAHRAASVSHDGEAVYGAQVIAAMEAQAFVEANFDRLLDTAVGLIPKDSVIYRLIGELRAHCAGHDDWVASYRWLAANYGYDKYGGNCHMVPNHGVIVLALLHGNGEFQRSLMIANTCGWDTDCNSGNVGCLMGIRNGLRGIEDGPDWRTPVADRLYLPTADGGRAITDAVTEAYRVINIGRALAGEEPLVPKKGARYHFSFPGSVQGFREEDGVESKGLLHLHQENLNVQHAKWGLVFSYTHVARGRSARAATATFIPEDAVRMPGYGLRACPTLYPGQTVRALVSSSGGHRPVDCRLYLRHYNADDRLSRIYGPSVTLNPLTQHHFEWLVPDVEGYPIADVGLEIASDLRADGSVCLEYLTWDGVPEVTLTRVPGTLWKRAWVDGVDRFESTEAEPFRLIQDEGTGLLIQGTREWTDYRVSARIRPHMIMAGGLAARVQGMRRYYALLLRAGGTVRLVRALDGETVLGETAFDWQPDAAYDLTLEVAGAQIRALVDQTLLFDVTDSALRGGAAALVCEMGRIAAESVRVQRL